MGIALRTGTVVRMARCLMMFHFYMRMTVGMYMIPAVIMTAATFFLMLMMIMAAATFFPMLMVIMAAAASFSVFMTMVAVPIMIMAAAATPVIVFVFKWQEICPHDEHLLIYE